LTNPNSGAAECDYISAGAEQLHDAGNSARTLSAVSANGTDWGCDL